MTSARKKQLIAVAVVALAGAGLSYIALGGLGENLVYYWSPAEIAAKGEAAKKATIRLGGVVQKGSLDWNPKTMTLRFTVGMTPEPGAPSVPVVSNAAPPQMFREGIGTVVEGTWDGQVFHAERLMVKHSNEYHPPKDGERPHEVYGNLQEDKQ